MAAVDQERMAAVMGQRFGAAGTATLRDWQKLLQEGAADAETTKLRRVNEFFNRRVRFSEDQTVWGQSDYWATPVETLGKGAGDCEDFAIAKYFSLLLLGLPVDKLRLIYVQARMGGPGSTISQAHMVLAYYSGPSAEPLVLDNLIDEVRPASRRADLVPVFSFNSQGLWQGISGARGSGGPSTLSRWQDLLNRARAEGFDGNWFEEVPKR